MWLNTQEAQGVPQLGRCAFNDDLDRSAQLSSRWAVIVVEFDCLAVASSFVSRIRAFRLEIVHHRLCSTAGEIEIVSRFANAIGIAVDFDSRTRRNCWQNFQVEDALIVGGDHVAVEVEQNQAKFLHRFASIPLLSGRVLLK